MRYTAEIRVRDGESVHNIELACEFGGSPEIEELSIITGELSPLTETPEKVEDIGGGIAHAQLPRLHPNQCHAIREHYDGWKSTARRCELLDGHDGRHIARIPEYKRSWSMLWRDNDLPGFELIVRDGTSEMPPGEACEAVLKTRDAGEHRCALLKGHATAHQTSKGVFFGDDNQLSCTRTVGGRQ